MLSLVEAIMRAARQHYKMAADMAPCPTSPASSSKNTNSKRLVPAPKLKPFNDAHAHTLNAPSPHAHARGKGKQEAEIARQFNLLLMRMRGERGFHPERIPKTEPAARVADRAQHRAA